MGFKSKTNHSNICKPFKIRGLIFDSEEDYLIFKNLDKNINQTVKSVNDGSINITEVFKNIKKINVRESYYEAREELDVIFINATSLLMYEDTRFQNDFKVGCCFFDKINVIKYRDSDSDSDSDSE